MNNKIYTCLWFDGQAKAAAEFYCSVFSNSKITADTPMVVTWELRGQKIMGLNGGPMFKINPSISFFATFATTEEVAEKYNKLLDGGKVLMPLDKYPWAEKYGWVQDKFGMTWQLMQATEQNVAGKFLPSLLFTSNQFGRAAEALKFYTSVFSDSSTILSLPYPDGDENAGKIMYSEFSINNYEVIAMDGPGAHEYTFNEAVSFVVDCKDQTEVDFFWNKLTADGGQESMCGWLKDKFGVSWQIVPKRLVELMNDKDKAKAGRAMHAMMKMKKIIIADLEKAYDG
jgi:predicted 3-demethylubiquinone-9 3-methyltransferase (glyoxalase superfamily)